MISVEKSVVNKEEGIFDDWIPFIPLMIKAILINPNIGEYKLCSLEYHEWHFVSRSATLDLWRENFGLLKRLVGEVSW